MDNPGKLADDTPMTNKNTKNSTICAGHHYPQINTINVDKIWPLLLATRGKDELNI